MSLISLTVLLEILDDLLAIIIPDELLTMEIYSMLFIIKGEEIAILSVLNISMKK